MSIVMGPLSFLLVQDAPRFRLWECPLFFVTCIVPIGLVLYGINRKRCFLVISGTIVWIVLGCSVALEHI